MTQYIIEARDVVYSYPDGTRALNGINIKIIKGKKIAVLGNNGAGKSTLFLHFNGILRPKHGQIIFQGQEIKYRQKNLMELRKNVGIVFQDPDNQLFSASVLQDIAFGPLNLGLGQKTSLARSEDAMRLTAIEELKNKPTHFLSYGQKKRVSIAGVLAMEPKVLIFDEPTACLDPQMSDKVMDLLQLLNQQGKTLILSTHDIDLAYSWADYVFLIREGMVIDQGSPGEIFLKPEVLKVCGLKTPWLIDVYLEMVNCGQMPSDTPIPRSKEELLGMIRNISIGNRETKLKAVQNS